MSSPSSNSHPDTARVCAAAGMPKSCSTFLLISRTGSFRPTSMVNSCPQYTGSAQISYSQEWKWKFPPVINGCDGSVLLKSTANKQAERDAIPNLSLRGFQVIDAVKSAVEKKCPGVVSCADILALVARDAVLMLHGPFWEVPTGRRDGRVSIASEALTNLPPPFANIAQLKGMFASKGLTVKDLVVLSGGHTIGTSHCSSFSNRIYNFTGKGDTDPKLDQNYVAQLKIKCKPGDANTLVEMDPGSFKTFDEDYYTLVTKRRGLFQSDSALLDDMETKAYVTTQAITHGLTFAKDFAASMVKMGNIGVLTGKNGEIRKQCAFIN